MYGHTSMVAKIGRKNFSSQKFITKILVANFFGFSLDRVLPVSNVKWKRGALTP